MIKALQFVRGAVAKKDLVPVLTNFHIYNGRIQGTNGRIYIDHPCTIEGEFTVPAERFLKAVDACDGEPILKIGEKLSIKKGKFRALLPLGEHADFPRGEPDGDLVGAATILSTLHKLWPFIGEDASRPWSCGVLFKDGYAYATNNVVIARVPAQFNFERGINIPVFAIEELLRIKDKPLKYSLSENNITFVYPNGAWLKTSLLGADWPPVEDMIHGDSTMPVDKKLSAAVEKILPFCPGEPTVLLNENGVSTEDGDMNASVSGASYPESRFRAEPLLKVLQVADYLDFTTYPSPCAWSGDGIDGLIIGVR